MSPAAQSTARRRAETRRTVQFERLVRTSATNAFGAEEAWAVSGAAFRARVAPARLAGGVEVPRVTQQEQYFVFLPAGQPLEREDRLRRVSDQVTFSVIRIDRPAAITLETVVLGGRIG